MYPARYDSVFKYNLSFHHRTYSITHTAWYGYAPSISRIKLLSQLGYILTNHGYTSKLQSRAESVRYLSGTDIEHIQVLNLDTCKYHQVGATDFKPYNLTIDPSCSPTIAFSTKLLPTRTPLPQIITKHVLPPDNFKMARKYPNASLRSVAHNAELNTVDSRNTIPWQPSTLTLPGTKIIPLIITYRYERDGDGNMA